MIQDDATFSVGGVQYQINVTCTWNEMRPVITISGLAGEIHTLSLQRVPNLVITLNGGSVITVVGAQFIRATTSGMGSTIQLYYDHVSISLAGGGVQPSKYRFSIVNFPFFGHGMVHRQVGDQIVGVDALQCTVGGKSLIIEKVPNYLSVWRRLMEEGGVDITAVISLDAAEFANFDDAKEFALTISDLLSFASANIVAPAKWTSMDAAGNLIAVGASSGIDYPYLSSSAPIVNTIHEDRQRPDELCRFLETAYPNVQSAETLFRLRPLIHIYVSIGHNIFTEVKYQLACNILEILKSQMKSNFAAIQAAYNPAIQPPPWLPRQKPDFKDVIKTVAEVLDVDMTSQLVHPQPGSWTYAFVAVRNWIIHDGQFPPGTAAPMDEVHIAKDLISKFMIRILKADAGLYTASIPRTYVPNAQF